MVALSLQTAIFVLALAAVVIGVVSAAAIQRLRLRDLLLTHSGIDYSRLAEFFDSAPFGLLLLDSQLRTIHTNTYARALLPNASLSEPSDNGAWQTEIRRDLEIAQAHNSSQSFYRVFTLPAGKTISWWICPLPRLNLLFINDLTHQRHLQKASQSFLNTLSHELRTPLTAITAHLDIVQTLEVDESTRQSSLTIIHQEVRRLTRLVQGILQLGRLEMDARIEKRPLDIFLVAEAAMAEVILMAETRDITLSLEATAGLPRIFGDADKLKQVFLNVLDNSIKYCRPGDRISVSLRPEAAGVLAVIQDTGPGILSPHISRVMERFYRVHEDSMGSGLGLAIASEVLRLHSTRLEIESPGDEETGVKVSFLLPVSGPESGDVTL